MICSILYIRLVKLSFIKLLIMFLVVNVSLCLIWIFTIHEMWWSSSIHKCYTIIMTNMYGSNLVEW